MAKDGRPLGGTERSRPIRFDALPDDVLLDVFDFYIVVLSRDKKVVETWQTLVHVCRRWRSLVFRSPRRLNLRLFCTPETRTMDPGTLDIWPALPIIIHGKMKMVTDNIIATLGHSNRVCEVVLWDIVGGELEEVLAAMQVPFPELTNLELWSHLEETRVIPDSFLDGSAPRLLHFVLDGIPFPGLPNLLLSATHLVRLCLYDIPHSGYNSPNAIVAILCALSCLKDFHLQFGDSEYHSNREPRRPLQQKCSILPALYVFRFQGVSEYLEDFVSLIDTPQLDSLQVTIFDQIEFDILRLAQFINRTPKLNERHEAHVVFNFRNVRILLGTLELFIPSSGDRRLSSVAQICNSTLHPLSTVEGLYIDHEDSQLDWTNNTTENTLWLQVLLPFTAVKKLYLSWQFTPGIAAAMQELVGGRVTEVLPSLQYIFVEELKSFEKNFSQFVVGRQLSGHPVAISDWDGDSNMEWT